MAVARMNRSKGSRRSASGTVPKWVIVAGGDRVEDQVGGRVENGGLDLFVDAGCDSGRAGLLAGVPEVGEGGGGDHDAVGVLGFEECIESRLGQTVRCVEVEDEDVGVRDDPHAQRCSMSEMRSDLVSSSTASRASMSSAAAVPVSAPRALRREACSFWSVTRRR
jgi:hypothetical protein